MEKITKTDTISTTDSGIDCSLLEEINRQAAVILNSPLLAKKLQKEDQEEPPPPARYTTNSSKKPHDSFDLTLQTSETNTSASSSPPHPVSEPSRSPHRELFSDSHAPNSSHLGLLLLTNVRRKLELEEERLEFEKEKQREKEKRKGKKLLFFRLSKRVRERMVDLPQSASDSALKKIDEDEVSTGNSSFFGEFRHASTDSGLIPSSASSADETLEEKVKRLEYELKESRRHATKMEAECQHLKKMQKALDNDVCDLTEALYQEAYRKVNEAKAKKLQAEKLLTEALLKVDLLQAEVKGLKDILKTPTKKAFKDRFHKKSESSVFFSSKGKSNSLYASPVKATSRSVSSCEARELEEVDPMDLVDPIYFKEYSDWISSSAIPLSDDTELPFLKRVMNEDVKPCLTFENEKLASEILDSIRKNTLEMEPYYSSEIGKRKCELTMMEKMCPYRLRTDADKEWVFISLQARNRITAVCDIFTYLRYLRNGIVKALPHDSYLEMTAMRKNMALARFGFDFTAKMNGTGLTATDE